MKYDFLCASALRITEYETQRRKGAKDSRASFLLGAAR